MKCKCEQCGREYLYERKKGHTLSRCNSCQVNCRRFEVMQRCLDYLGGKCQLCGYDKCSRALCFHHRNPKEKDFIISGNTSRKWEVLKEELDKCDLLCANCHMEVHSKEDNAHQFVWKKAHRVTNKICPQCGDSFKPDKQKAIFCSVKCSNQSRRK